jgi:leucyl aminopeptidase
VNIQARALAAVKADVDALIIYLFQGEAELKGAVGDVNLGLDGLIQELIETGDISGKVGDIQVLYPRGAIAARRVVLVGLGEKEEFNPEALRIASAGGAKKTRDLKAKTAAMVLDGLLSIEESAQALAEGALLGLYAYHGQKSSDVPDALPETLEVLVSDEANVSEAERGITKGVAFADGAYMARNLVNLPPNICTPSYMADQAQAMAEDLGLKFEAFGRQKMQALKMGALLGVAQGSDAPPRFIILEHNAERAEELDTIVLVGKGVTFDTGGYSLKSGEGMVGMKADMGGGAAVLGAMRIVAKLNVPLHVVGLVPASDNMISGGAYRPQEVVTAGNGKTIEVISTDAEGRMLLADALVYAKRYSPAAVVDIATLTGACVVALGGAAAGMFSINDTLRDNLLDAADSTGEKVWPLPLFPEYEKSIESQTADMKNSGGRRGGVGTSATFLKNFVDYPAWAHVDMAGMAGMDGFAPGNGKAYLPAKGATGFGARLLAEFVRQWGER